MNGPHFDSHPVWHSVSGKPTYNPNTDKPAYCARCQMTNPTEVADWVFSVTFTLTGCSGGAGYCSDPNGVSVTDEPLTYIGYTGSPPVHTWQNADGNITLTYWTEGGMFDCVWGLTVAESNLYPPSCWNGYTSAGTIFWSNTPIPRTVGSCSGPDHIHVTYTE